MQLFLHKNDIPSNLNIIGDIAIDTEAMGLKNHRDRLCLIQLTNGNGDVHIIQFQDRDYSAYNLRKLLTNPDTMKIMHFARFDVSIIYKYLGIVMRNIYCTKIASKLARTYTEQHGLKDLCRELLGVNLSKAQQSTYWGSEDLTQDQLNYAASDVIHLHKIRDKLNLMLKRENRMGIADECFNFLPYRSMLDVMGWEEDIFAH